MPRFPLSNSLRQVLNKRSINGWQFSPIFSRLFHWRYSLARAIADYFSAIFSTSFYYCSIKSLRPMTQTLTGWKKCHRNKGFLIGLADIDFSLARGVEAGASATPPSSGTVYNPGIFWGFGNRKRLQHIYRAAVSVNLLYVVIISANATL